MTGKSLMDSQSRTWSSEVVRLVCISDTHGKESSQDLQIPNGDVLIHVGDFTRIGRLPELQSFRSFIDNQPHHHKVVISGNHEITLDEAGYASNARLFHYSNFKKKSFSPGHYAAECKEVMTAPADGYRYLEDTTYTVLDYSLSRKQCGITVYGSPYQPEHLNMAFNLLRGEELKRKWSLIPDNLDVLVTHTPPYDILDTIEDGSHVGCEELLQAVTNRVKPRVHVFGHIHEAYGRLSNLRFTVNVNVSSHNKV
jgi:Icc-related predicted phosphoesterase